MSTCWMNLNSHLISTWKMTSMHDYLWTMIGLLATGWFLATIRRA